MTALNYRSAQKYGVYLWEIEMLKLNVLELHETIIYYSDFAFHNTYNLLIN
jgi:hypothetical protein